MTVLLGGLYAGPFLAGLSGQPGWTYWAFAALLGLWGFLYQRRSWPARLSDLATAVGVAKTLVLSGVVLAVAGIAFLAGAGLAHITGVLPLPLAATIALPVATLAIAVLVQSPRKAADFDAFLDDALRQLQGMAPGPEPSRQAARAEELAARIASLPADAGPDHVLAELAGTDELDAALLAAIDGKGAALARPLRLAAVLLVTDVVRGAGLAGRAEAAWVFDVARGDTELEVLFATRALRLLSEMPDMWRDMPYAYDVAAAIGAGAGPEAVGRLSDLRDRLNALSSEDA
jgi:hypothetical protein